jgi:soluble lytic murein transglycosylase-like protein
MSLPIAIWKSVSRLVQIETSSLPPTPAATLASRSILAWPASSIRASKFLLALLLLPTVAAICPSALGVVLADEPTSAEHQAPAESREAEQDQQQEPSASPAAPASLCEALAKAAASHDLPADFFARLIWQESRFKADAVSPAGAQGVAQFMPATARLRQLENPFNPLEAIAKSAQLLGELRREFGNVGLAAAAYNAGSGRVRDWLVRRRPLPGETQTYVRLVTGRSVEEWAGGQTSPLETRSLKVVPCDLLAAALVHPNRGASTRTETIKPWGVEVVGSSTPALALARYREWRSKYAAIVGDREPHVVIRGILGDMGAARVRIGADTQIDAAKLCAALRAARTYCDVLRN